MTSNLPAPVAPKKPKELSIHGDVRIDDYYWMRDRRDPDTLKYLEAENAYTDAVMAPLKPLEDRLYDEILGRIRQTDLSVPAKEGDYFYYGRTEEGKQYPIFCRHRALAGAPEEILLDAEDVSIWLKVSEDWVWDHASRRAPFLPAIWLSDGALRFKRNKIAEFRDETERLSTKHRKRR